MSFETATATDHLDLLARIRTFCESTILPSGERWTVERYSGAQEYLFSTEFGGFEAFLGFNGSGIEPWRTAIGSALPSYLGCDFVTPIDIRQIIMQGPRTSDDPTMAPVDFDLEWSDNGSVWNSLETFAAGSWGDNTIKTFNVTAGSPGARRYWRVYITTNNGHATQTSIANLELLTDEGGTFLNQAEEPQLIMRGPGLAASDQIFVGLQLYTRPTSDIYNCRIAAFTGYVSSNPFGQQPGNFGTAVGFPLWNQNLTYWLAANGRRIAIVAKIETTYQTAYMGHVLPYATPGQWPYPITVLGMLPADTLTRYSDTGIKGPWETPSAQLRVRLVGGTWLEPECFPWSNSRTLRDTPGAYGILPVLLNDADGIYGELDGIAHVTGFNNAVENTVDIGGTDHLVVHDVYRTGIRDYHALRLD